jgi:hypothetical protein
MIQEADTWGIDFTDIVNWETKFQDSSKFFGDFGVTCNANPGFL